MFQPTPDKPFVATTCAIDMYQQETIIAGLRVLQERARHQGGLDYLQVFESDKPESLMFIEDPPGGEITALVPSDY